MEYKKKINSEIKNNYKSNNLQNNKNKYSNKQNIITNNKNNNLKSHPFKMIGNYKKTLNKTLNKSYPKINTHNNKNYYSKSLSSKKIKANCAIINKLNNSNNTININEENINDSYILNKNNLKKKNFNINLKDNNINKEQLLNKILSKYILEGIFDYICDRNFKLKLFEYSNLFQKKLDINIFNYQEKYLDKNGFDIIKYFSFIYNSSENFSKDLLKDELEKDLLKTNFEKKNLNNYIKRNFKRFKINEKYRKFSPLKFNADLIQVDIFSPFFDILSEIGFLELGSIIIQINLIEKYDLKKDYILAFEKLNKSNIKYTTLTCNFQSNDDIKYLKDFHINFNQIKNLIFYEEKECGIMNHDYFFDTLFTIEGIVNNLVILDIKIINDYYTEPIDPKALKNLNNFKSLKILRLENLQTENIFLLKLKNLETLTLINCDIILLDENIGLNMKNLILSECSLEKPKNPLKLPELISLILIFLQDQKSYHIIDYSSMKKLKSAQIDSKEFLFLSNSPLEFIRLNPFKDYDSYDLEKKIIEKIFLIKTLENISIPIMRMNIDDISNIINENNTLKKLEIYWKNKSCDCILDNIENKFPNLSELIINQEKQYNHSNNKNEIKLEIIQNPKCNINKLRLDCICINTKLYCKPFEKLIELIINLDNEINNLKDTLPIFGDKCKTIFSKLKSFHFSLKTKVLSMDILNNIYNNFDKMPNLKQITLDLIIDKLNKDILNKLINKIKSLDITGHIKIVPK